MIFCLTSVINRVRHNRLECEGEGSLFIALEEDLKCKSDTVEVDILRTGLVCEPGCKSRTLQISCKKLPPDMRSREDFCTYFETGPRGSAGGV